jgi:hypothetical protein
MKYSQTLLMILWKRGQRERLPLKIQRIDRSPPGKGHIQNVAKYTVEFQFDLLRVV